MFNADEFMNSVVTEVNSTKIKPAPVGEYPATIKAIGTNSGTISKGARIGEPWASLNVTAEINDVTGVVEAATGIKNKQVRGSIMLDLTSSGQSLDMSEGKNVKYGRLRAAAGLNDPGQPFSPNMLIGRSVRIKVGHRTDPDDASLIYDEITAYAPL